MKKIISLLGLVAAFGLGALLFAPNAIQAAGHIGPLDVISQMRTWQTGYRVWVPDVASNTNDQTVGRAGVVMKASMNALLHVVQTTSIAAMPYPAKVLIYVKDGNNSGTSACTGDMHLRGYNQYGEAVGETLTTDLAEGTALKSVQVYERLTYFDVSGCTGGSNAADTVQVAASLSVGIPIRIKSLTAILSLCATDVSADTGDGSASDYCWDVPSVSEDASFSPVTGIQYIDLYGNSSAIASTTGVGVSDTAGNATLDMAFNDGDTIKMRIRPPAGL